MVIQNNDMLTVFHQNFSSLSLNNEPKYVYLVSPFQEKWEDDIHRTTYDNNNKR